MQDGQEDPRPPSRHAVPPCVRDGDNDSPAGDAGSYSGVQADDMGEALRERGRGGEGRGMGSWKGGGIQRVRGTWE